MERMRTNWDASVDTRLISETDPMLQNESSSAMDVLVEFNFQTVKRWLDDGLHLISREVNEPAISRFTCIDFSAENNELTRLLVEELRTFGVRNRRKEEILFGQGIVHGRAIGRMWLGKSVLVFRITKYIQYLPAERSLHLGWINNGAVYMIPASKEAIVSLQKKKKEGGDEVESCSVCLEELQVGVVVSTLPCSHNFHSDCVVKWLNISHYCPICRFEMPIV